MALVLIVDDEASIRLTLAEFLRADGHDVAVAENATAALEAIALTSFDVVVSDIIMPRMTGMQLLDALKGAGSRAKVILITGEPTFDTAAAAVRLGAFDYLAKPVRGAAVCKVVRAAAELKALEDENRRYRTELEALVEERTRQLRESEARYRRMTDSSLTGIGVQQGGALLFANPRLAEIVGSEVSQPGRAKPLQQYLHPADRAAFEEQFARCLNDPGGYATCVGRVCRPDGSDVWIEVLPCLIEHEGVEAVMVTVIDVSPRVLAEKRAEELREQLLQAQKLEAVGRLAGGVAHDFNNMLTVIRGNAELAWSSLPEGHAVRSDLEEVRKAAQRAADLTNQLLAFSRKQMIAPQVLRLEERLEQARRMLSRLIGEHIELVIRTEPGLWPVLIDPTQVDQILANLITNARDAMPEGGRIVVDACNVQGHDLEAREVEGSPKSDYVALFVTDTGRGIDAETREKIFEPFFTTKGVGKGTGLGLATVYGIVKQNGGAVRVESGVGGTTFRIFLPRSLEQAAPIREEDSPVAGVGGAETILLVEDEAQVRALAKRMLEQHGYRVFAAAEPSEALRLIAAGGEQIDLLLTDVVMPGMSGPALYQKLKTPVPALRVVYMTGYAEDVVGRHGILDAGALLIQKPFTMGELIGNVREALAR